MPTLRTLSTDQLAPSMLAGVRRLLDEAFDGDFADDDWEHALGGRHVVVLGAGAVLAHVAVVPRTLEVAGRPLRTGYLEAVASDPARHGEGLGSLAVVRAGELVRAGFEVGALSTGRHAFYERHGWQRWRGPTFVRRGAQTVRSPADDDGVMVLRFGPSSDVDLAAPLSCEERRGDDW